MKLKPYLIFLIPILVLIVLRVPSLFESYWYGDEGIYAAVAQEMSRGKALYAQTWDHKPPLIFWLFYLGALAGWEEGFVLLRGINVVLGVLTLIFVGLSLKKVKMGDRQAFVALLFLSLALGSPLFEGNILNAEVIFLAFNTLAFFLLLARKYYPLVGFLAFASLATKVPGFVELALVMIAFFIIYLKEKGFSFVFRSAVKIGLGFLAPLLLLILSFWLKGTLSDFLYTNVLFNRIYSMHGANFLELFGLRLPSLYPQLISLGLVFCLSALLFFKKRLSVFAFLAVNLLSAQFFASLLSAKNYGHYFLQLLPSLAFLLALGLKRAKNALKLEGLLSGAALAVMISPFLLVYRLGGTIQIHAHPIRYYQHFINGYLFGQSDAKSRFWWGAGDGVAQTMRLARHLESHYQGFDQVYFYSDKPWVIALADRQFTNKYVVWFHLSYLKTHLKEELGNIKRADLVVIDKDAPALEEVFAQINKDFEKIDSFDKLEILVKKP